MQASLSSEGRDLRVHDSERRFTVRWRNGTRYPYDVMPDDSRFLFATLAEAQTTSPVTLVVKSGIDLRTTIASDQPVT